MRLAVILHGNLRTFFLPIDNKIRICDVFLNFISKCNPDIFLVTDSTDFYYNGAQYLDSRSMQQQQKGSVFNTIKYMVFHTIKYMDSEKARTLLLSELNNFLGKTIKGIEVQTPTDISLDPKFVLISSQPEAGCFPEGLVRQYLKIKRAYTLLEQYEKQNSIHYDLILRSRFDNRPENKPMDIHSYDFENYDVFVPGFFDSGIIYDWSALGKRQPMSLALNLYDNLGFTLEKRIYRCKKCGMTRCGNKSECECGGETVEFTLSSEYHLYRLFKDNNVKCAYGCPMSPYRYPKKIIF